MGNGYHQVPGLAQMTSSSALGYTQITLQFSRDRTVDSAAQDVQAAINATGGHPHAFIRSLKRQKRSR
jgi:multidrug efflux pump subunit AcrB